MKRNNTSAYLHKRCNVCGLRTTWTHARNHAGKCKTCATKTVSEKIDKVRREYAAGRLTQEAFEKIVSWLHAQDPK